jgi:hypothetical protein
VRGGDWLGAAYPYFSNKPSNLAVSLFVVGHVRFQGNQLLFIVKEHIG